MPYATLVGSWVLGQDALMEAAQDESSLTNSSRGSLPRWGRRGSRKQAAMDAQAQAFSPLYAVQDLMVSVPSRLN